MSEYKNYGQAGAFGDQARSDKNNFAMTDAKSQINLDELFKQITIVRTAMTTAADPKNAEQRSEIHNIELIENAAKSGDVSKSLDMLKGAGKWTLEVAKSVAAGLVKDAVEGKFSS